MRLPSRFVFSTLGWLILLVPMVVSICDEFRLMDPAGSGNTSDIGITTEKYLKMKSAILGPFEANGNGLQKTSGNMIGETRMMNEYKEL